MTKFLQSLLIFTKENTDGTEFTGSHLGFSSR